MQSEINAHDKMIIEQKLQKNADIVNAALEKYLELYDKDYNRLFDSMRYSCFAGGKKIRAFLVLQFFSIFNGSDINIDKAVPLAAAVEMIHTYSLIHDDLPCMDNDDLRRGKPTNHKAFGEATALLAGDALLTYAFNVIANAEMLSSDEKVKIISELSYAAGHKGMIGGQMIDMNFEESKDSGCENKIVDVISLIKLHTLKTGNMIMAASRIGSIAGGAAEEEIVLVTNYAKNIGLAFQVIDDILDSTGDSALLGKNTGSDIKNAKTTFLNILSKDDAYEYAKNLSIEAILCLDKLKEMRGKDGNTEGIEILEMLAKYLLDRKT